MNSILRKMSLKQRIWISFVLLTVVCIATTGTYVSVFFSQEMQAQTTKTGQETLNKTAQVLDERLRNIVVLVSTFMMGESFQQTMRNVQGNQSQNYYNLLSQLQTPFAQMMIADQSIDSVFITTPIGEFYPLEIRPNKEVAFKDTLLYSKLEQAPSRWNKIWVEGHQDQLFARANRVISLIIKPLFDGTLQNSYVVVNIREDYLEELTGAHLQSASMKQLVLDRDATKVFDSTRELQPFELEFYDALLQRKISTDEIYSYATEDYFVNYAGLEMNPDWVFIGYQSKEEFRAQVKHIQVAIMTIMLICIVIALIMSSMLSGLLLKPLYKLRNLMFKVEQSHLDVRFESQFEDEVSQVGQKFNRMMDQIAELIDEVKQSEYDKRKSEVKALQAQIDPHFLYNTLNTIYWKSEMSEKAAVNEMIISLSLLFRLGLNGGQEITSIEKEIAHVEQYLKIQKMCYSDLFDYVITVHDKVMLERKILKILLQPLVENSILHGFQNISYKGMIEIELSEHEQCMILQVTDNGSGMNTSELEHRLAKPGKTGSSYALSNVKSRLSLYYGEAASITFDSEPNVRTTVTLCIPKELKEAENYVQHHNGHY